MVKKSKSAVSLVRSASSSSVDTAHLLPADKRWPKDILLLVLQYLTRTEDIYNVAQVCKRFNTVFSPTLTSFEFRDRFVRPNFVSVEFVPLLRPEQSFPAGALFNTLPNGSKHGQETIYIFPQSEWKLPLLHTITRTKGKCLISNWSKFNYAMGNLSPLFAELEEWLSQKMKAAQIFYHSGHKHGDEKHSYIVQKSPTAAVYHESGREYQCSWKNGKKDGEEKHFGFSGKTYLCGWKNGLKHGIEQSFKTGRLTSSIEWENGRKHGEEKEYYSDAILKRSCTYQHNEKDGEEIVYWPNGRMKSSIFYIDGFQEGEEVFFDAKGKKVTSLFLGNIIDAVIIFVPLGI